MFEDRNNIIGHDNYGCIYCYDPVNGDRHLMGFEKHFIRGIKKMKMRCSLALIVMLVKEIAILREGVKLRRELAA